MMAKLCKPKPRGHVYSQIGDSSDDYYLSGALTQESRLYWISPTFCSFAKL